MMPQSIHRRALLKAALTTAAGAAALPFAEALPLTAAGGDDRAFWRQILERVAEPVLDGIGHERLKATMPVECAAGQEASRRECTYLEAFARLLCGLAPWLALEGLAGAESALQTRYRELARAGIRHGTDPASPDYLNFGATPQSLVDTAFLALAIVRAPGELWQRLDQPTQRRLVQALTATRKILPGRSNWLLFSAMIEACLCAVGGGSVLTLGGFGGGAGAAAEEALAAVFADVEGGDPKEEAYEEEEGDCRGEDFVGHGGLQSFRW